MNLPSSLRLGWRAWLLIVVGMFNIGYGIGSHGDVWILIGMGFLALARWFVTP